MPASSLRSWLGKAGGTVQFLAAEDAFVFTKVVCAESASQLTSWSAARRGAPRRPAAGASGEGKRSLLQRWGWYVLMGFGYYSYMAVKEQAAGGAKKGS